MWPQKQYPEHTGFQGLQRPSPTQWVMKAWDECLTEAAVVAEYTDLFEGMGHLQGPPSGERQSHACPNVPPPSTVGRS